MSDDLVVARKFSSDIDAGFGKSILDAEGIQCTILKDDAGGMMPQFQMVEGVRLMVNESDLERAQAVLDQADAEAQE